MSAPPARHQPRRTLNAAAERKRVLIILPAIGSVDRYQSLSDPDKLLSMSFFTDERAVAAWRGLQAHRDAQSAGRAAQFAHYRLRVAQVLRDYGMTDRAQAPADSKDHHAK